MSFLTAEWRKLALANYELDPSILQPFVPSRTELDLWNGCCYVSLVGFMFVDTRLFGLPIPFHRNFEEVNLRFYVRYREDSIWKRGVVFIKEIVPKHALTLVANWVYKEHYETMGMDHAWEETEDDQVVKYLWGEDNHFHVRTSKEACDIGQGSEAEFITEHYWGYTRASQTKTYEYEVTHPTWQVYDVINYSIKVDFGLLYGKPFAALSASRPKSVMLAEGSRITVESKRLISR